jgi:hypothetical protein
LAKYLVVVCREDTPVGDFYTNLVRDDTFFHDVVTKLALGISSDSGVKCLIRLGRRIAPRSIALFKKNVLEE